jgi:hypothetical protein
VARSLTLCLASLATLISIASVHAQSIEIAANDEKPYVMVEASTELHAVKAYQFRSEFGCFLAGRIASHQEGIDAMCYGKGLNGRK